MYVFMCAQVNQASVSVDGKMVCVVGDDKAVVMLERETGDRIATLHGHCDHGFASDFHCDGRLCATGGYVCISVLCVCASLSLSLCVCVC